MEDEILDMMYSVARFELRRLNKPDGPTIQDAIYAGITAALAVDREIARLKKSGT